MPVTSWPFALRHNGFTHKSQVLIAGKTVLSWEAESKIVFAFSYLGENFAIGVGHHCQMLAD